MARRSNPAMNLSESLSDEDLQAFFTFAKDYYDSSRLFSRLHEYDEAKTYLGARHTSIGGDLMYSFGKFIKDPTYDFGLSVIEARRDLDLLRSDILARIDRD